MAETQAERRRHERYKLDRGAQIGGSGAAAKAGGRTSDISVSGVALRDFEAPHGLDEGDEITVEIEGGEGGEEGKVVRAGRVVRAVEDFVAVSFEDFYEHEELAELGIDIGGGPAFD